MIFLYAGLPGGGKSYALVREIHRARRRRRPVWSNVPVDLPGVYRLEPEYLIECDFPRGSLVVVDEAGGQRWFNSRNWANFPAATFEFFSQHRKGGLDILIGVQHPRRVDVSLRELVHVFVLCEPALLGLGHRYTESHELVGERLDPSKGRSRSVLRVSRVMRSYDSWARDHEREQEAPREEWRGVIRREAVPVVE